MLASLSLVATSCTTGEGVQRPGLSFAGTKIGFLFVGARDDLGYNQAAWEGSEAVAKAFPDLKVLRAERVPETAAAGVAMEKLIKEGARILFPTSFGYLKWAVEVARRHPEVIVLHQGGLEPKPGLDNLGTYWGTVYEPVYQAGIAAGAATTTNKLGFVAAFPIPATFANVNAFTLGARSVNPAARTTVSFTQDWCDPDTQGRVAEELLAMGVDVLAQHQDCTTTILQVAEKAGIWSVGYHEDGSEVAPKGWLVGAVWNWGPLFVDLVKTVLDGEFAGNKYDGDYRGGYKTGNNPFVLTEPGPGVTAATAALIVAAGERFRSGSSPFAGPLRDRDGGEQVAAGVTPSLEQTDAMDYFVDGVDGSIP